MVLKHFNIKKFWNRNNLSGDATCKYCLAVIFFSKNAGKLRFIILRTLYNTHTTPQFD